ncbi:MAG: ABCB family ABC transporter ATP-binding protein/permease [Alphaproteobacteria bacterium]
MSQPEEQTGLKSETRAIRSLAPYLWPAGEFELKVRVAIALVLLVAAKVAIVYVPLIYKAAVDTLTATADNATQIAVTVPIALILAYGGAQVASRALGELRDFVFAKVSQRAIRVVALKTFRHLHRLSLRFHLDRQTGGLSRAIERGLRGIDFLLRFMLFNIVPTLLELLMVSVILWTLYGVRFTLVTLGTIIVYIVYTLTVTEWRLKFRRAMNESDSEANTKAIDSLLNYETVKYFGNEEHEAQRYDKAVQRYETMAVRSLTSLSLVNIGQGFIISTGLIGNMVMAGFGVADGTMTVGDFVAVNAYLIQLSMPLNFLGFVYREIKQSLTDMQSMFGLLNVNREIEDRPDAPPLKVEKGTVAFENVSFSYDERRPVLKDVSFVVPAGHTVAIVGPTGAGKSTISRLLFRFYDVNEGRITIDGQDLRDVQQSSLRGAIGIVPQDTVLFNDTIFYNIQYGRPDASREEVENAARLAQVHDFVMAMPDGYETRVGERGLKLSGGEKQRVAIARTILKNPQILMFDEATSALDTHTEKEIQAALESVSADHTTLIIAHRLSTVVQADQIIVLDDGHVVERGRHDELLALGGKYAALWARQRAQQDKEEKALEEVAVT